MNKLKLFQTRTDQTNLIIIFVMFVVLSVIVSGGALINSEYSLFAYINNWPDYLTYIFLVVTQFGSAWAVFGLTLTFIGVKRSRIALRLFAMSAIAVLITETLKHIIKRPRPLELFGSGNVREIASSGYGFPSSHTAIATVIGLIILGMVPKKYRWICWFGIFLVGLSRIYLGVHSPLDVLGGFLVGIFVVGSVSLIRGKLKTVLKITGLKLQR